MSYDDPYDESVTGDTDPIDVTYRPYRKTMTVNDKLASVNVRLKPSLKGQIICHVTPGQELLTEGEPEGDDSEWQPVVVYVQKTFLE